MESSLSKLSPLLLAWYDAGHRQLPWRQDREPYHVWLSEIMLQQTRVEAVRGYYARFLEALPSIEALANCDPERLAKLWEGLGYYSRMRNLQKAARIIMDEYGGRFPQSYQQIRALPGIGDYTAGAIASICFSLPTPAVDGNVLRVLSRLLADFSPITKPQTKKAYTGLLARVYPKERCGDLTQSLIELGAVCCVPNGAPKCQLCPLAELCQANAQGLQAKLPVKEPKKEKRTEEKTVFILRCGDKLALRKREDKGLLAGLWELPNLPEFLSAQQALDQAQAWGLHPRELVKCEQKEHIFTHIRWQMLGYTIQCAQPEPCFVWADPKEQQELYSLPSAFRIFLED